MGVSRSDRWPLPWPVREVDGDPGLAGRGVRPWSPCWPAPLLVLHGLGTVRKGDGP